MLPRRALTQQPRLSVAEAGWIDLAGADPPDFLRPHQLAVLQHPEVLDSRGDGHPEQGRQLAHSGRAAGQALDHRPPVRVRERVEHPVRGLRLMLKHALNFNHRRAKGQVST